MAVRILLQLWHLCMDCMSLIKMCIRDRDSVFQDIYPDAVKIGMVSDKDLIHVIAEKLKQYKAENIVDVYKRQSLG